jgi:hypothetical protein
MDNLDLILKRVWSYNPSATRQNAEAILGSLVAGTIVVQADDLNDGRFLVLALDEDSLLIRHCDGLASIKDLLTKLWKKYPGRKLVLITDKEEHVTHKDPDSLLPFFRQEG